MRILFVHQNFPGQFLHLASALKTLGHEVRAITDIKNKQVTDIETIRYQFTPERIDPKATRLGRNYTLHSDRGVQVARVASKVRDQLDFFPDLIVGHSGWGETLFLKEVWPKAKLLIYAEFYYRGLGADVGFDPEFSAKSFESQIIAQGRSAYLAQALVHADRGMAPTYWQASNFPKMLRDNIDVVFDGVDCDRLKPNPQAQFTLPNGRTLAKGDEVLTFVNRNLEPYRGYHIFMRALPEILKARPNAQVIIIGGDGVSYGSAPEGETGWKDLILSEVKERLDLDRVHFLGRIAYQDYCSAIQVSRVHAYLTYPFVLSWSMIEAMAMGALVVGSKTAPVEEVIEDKINGLLVDFFDVSAWETALIDALAHPEKYDLLRNAARETVLARYDLRTICLPRQLQILANLMRG